MHILGACSHWGQMLHPKEIGAEGEGERRGRGRVNGGMMGVQQCVIMK